MTRRSGGRQRATPGRGGSPPVRSTRAWELIALAVAGAGVAGYLTWTKLTGGAPVCGDSGGCAIVQASRFAVFLSVPTAAWGLAFYALVGFLAWRGLTGRRWLPAYLLAVTGVAFSTYLTAVARLSLQVVCLWCLASAGLTVAILVAVCRRRPVGAHAALGAARLLGWGAVAAGLVIGVAAWLYAMAPEAWAARQQALAAHLRASGAVMYGAFWCPVCREQKAQFGTAASELPYVECDPGGVGARPDQCARAGVQRYPTWVIGGQTYLGLHSLDELARLSGFTAGAAGRPGG